MRIKVTKNQLLSSVGDAERIVLNKCILNDFYYVTGELIGNEMTNKIHGNRIRNAKKYPIIAQALTPIQFNMFSALLNGENSSFDLIKYTKSTGSFNSGNLVAVHIAQMRNKFKKFKIPYFIENLRKSYQDYAFYQLKNK